MSRYPSRYRGAYDYDYNYGEYDHADRGSGSSPGYWYDEHDHRGGQSSSRGLTNSVQSAYADYYSDPRDCYSSPSRSSEPALEGNNQGPHWKPDERAVYGDQGAYAHRNQSRLYAERDNRTSYNYDADVYADHAAVPVAWGQGRPSSAGPYADYLTPASSSQYEQTTVSDTRPHRRRRNGNSTRLTNHDTPVAPLSPSRAYSTSSHADKLFTVRPTFTKPRSPTPPPPPPRVPDATYLATSLIPSTPLPSPLPASARKLLILDLNGTLLIRPARAAHPRPRHGGPIQDLGPRFRPVHPRPYMPTFRAYLFDDRTRGWLDTMVWSSAQPHSVDDMISHCFDPAVDGEEQPSKPGEGSTQKRGRDNLVAVWARDTLGLSETEYNRKSQTVKDLTKPWAQISPGSGSTHSAHTTLLLDDSPLKARLQPYNHVCIREYAPTVRGADLEVLARERRALDPQVEGGKKKRKRKAKKAAAGAGNGEREKMRMQGQGESESGASVSSIDAVAPRESGDAVVAVTDEVEVQPAGKYDETLLAVIGVLDAVSGQSNVAGWVRAGGLWGSNPPHAQSEVLTTRTGYDVAPALGAEGADTAMWFDREETLEYWARRGREVVEEMGIDVVHGIIG